MGLEPTRPILLLIVYEGGFSHHTLHFRDHFVARISTISTYQPANKYETFLSCSGHKFVCGFHLLCTAQRTAVQYKLIAFYCLFTFRWVSDRRREWRGLECKVRARELVYWHHHLNSMCKLLLRCETSVHVALSVLPFGQS